MNPADDEPLLGADDSPPDEDDVILDDDDTSVDDVTSADDGPAEAGCCKRFRRLVTVEPVAFLYFISMVSSYSAGGQYVYGVFSKKHGWIPPADNVTNCTQETVQSPVERLVMQEVSQFYILTGLVCLAPSAVAALLMGHYSDTRGRRLPLIAPLVGSLINSILVTIVAVYDLNIYYIMLGNLIESFTGGIASLFMAMFSIIADVTAPANRSQRIYIIDAVISIAVAIATISTGYIISDYGFIPTFLYANAAIFVALVIAVFYVQETVSVQRSAPLFSCYNVVTTFRLYLWPSGERRPKLLVMLAIILLSVMNDDGGISSTFLLGYPNCFDPVILGYFQAATYAFRAVGGLLMMRGLRRCVSDTGFIIVGTISTALTGIAWGFATNKTIVFLTPVIGCASMLTLPLCRALSSKLVVKGQQGAMFAAIAFCEQLSGYLGGIVFNLVYMHTLHVYFGIVFFFGAGIAAITLFLAISLHYLVHKPGQIAMPVMEESPTPINA